MRKLAKDEELDSAFARDDYINNYINVVLNYLDKHYIIIHSNTVKPISKDEYDKFHKRGNIITKYRDIKENKDVISLYFNKNILAMIEVNLNAGEYDNTFTLELIDTIKRYSYHQDALNELKNIISTLSIKKLK